MFSLFKKKVTAKKEHQSTFVHKNDYQYVHDKFINFCELENQPLNKKVVTEINYRIKKADKASSGTGKAKLNLKSCSLIDEEVNLLVQVLASKPVIAKLDLRGNKITDMGADPIIELLEAQCKIVRNVNVRDRKHILFLDEVLLTGNKISLTALKRVNLLSESLNHANAVSHIYKIYNRLKEPIFIDYNLVEKIWSEVVGPPKKSEIDKAFAFANVIDLSNLTYCDMEAGILEGMRLKGVVSKLNTKQTDDITANPDAENENIIANNIEFKGQSDSVSNVTSDDFEENQIRKIATNNSFDFDSSEPQKIVQSQKMSGSIPLTKTNITQMNSNSDSMKLVAGSILITNQDSRDSECKLGSSGEIYTVNNIYRGNSESDKIDSPVRSSLKPTEDIILPVSSKSPVRSNDACFDYDEIYRAKLTTSTNNLCIVDNDNDILIKDSNKKSINVNKNKSPVPMSNKSSSASPYASPVRVISKTNSKKSIDNDDSKANIVTEYDENVFDTSVSFVSPSQKLRESKTDIPKAVENDDEVTINNNKDTSSVNKALFLNTSYQSIDSESRNFNDLVNRYTPEKNSTPSTANSRKQESLNKINNNNNKILSVINSKGDETTKFNNRYNPSNIELSMNDSIIVSKPLVSSHSSYNDGAATSDNFDELSFKVQRKINSDSDDDLPNIKSNAPSAIKVQRDVLPDSEDEQTNNMLSKFSTSFSQPKEVDSDDDYSPSGTKMVSQKKFNSSKKPPKSPGSVHKSSSKKTRSIADKIKSPTLFSPTGEPPNETVEDLLAKLKTKGSSAKKNSAPTLESVNTASTNNAPSTVLKSVPSEMSLTQTIPVTPLFHFDSIYKSSSNEDMEEEENAIIPLATRSSSVENPIFAKSNKHKYVQPDNQPMNSNRFNDDIEGSEMKIFDDKEFDEIQASISSLSMKTSFKLQSNQHQIMDETLTDAVASRNLLGSIKKKVDHFSPSDQNNYNRYSSPVRNTAPDKVTDDTTDNDEATSSSNHETRRKGSKPATTTRSDFIMAPAELKQNSYSCLDLADKKLRDGFDFSLFISPHKYGALKVLILRNNEIEELNELLIGERFTRLIELDLAYNYISCKSFNLPHTLLRLDLSYNDISDTSGFMVCIALQELNLAFNSIRKVNGFPATLKRLDLSNNCISSTLNIRLLSLSPELESINLANNPVTERDPQWKLKLKSFLPKLITIDGIIVNQKLAQKQREEETKQLMKKPVIPREIQETNDMKRSMKKKLSQEEIDKDLNKLVDNIRRQKTISPSKVNALAERLSYVSPRLKAVNSKTDPKIFEKPQTRPKIVKKRSLSPSSMDTSLASSISRSTSPSSSRGIKSIEPLKRSTGKSSMSEQGSKRLGVQRTESLFNASVLESVDLEEFNYNVREFDEDGSANGNDSFLTIKKQPTEISSGLDSTIVVNVNQIPVDSVREENNNLAKTSFNNINKDTNDNKIETITQEEIKIEEKNEEMSARDRFLAKVKKFNSDTAPKTPVVVTSKSFTKREDEKGEVKINQTNEEDKNVKINTTTVSVVKNTDDIRESPIIVKKSLSASVLISNSSISNTASNDGISSKMDSLSIKLSQIEEMTKSNFTQLEEVTKLTPTITTGRRKRSKSISSTTSDGLDNNRLVAFVTYNEKDDVSSNINSNETKSTDGDQSNMKTVSNSEDNTINSNIQNKTINVENVSEISIKKEVSLFRNDKQKSNENNNTDTILNSSPKEDQILILNENVEEKKEVIDKSKLSAKERLLLRMSSNKNNNNKAE